jgi:soluble lytic murein transglycosylase
VKRLITLLVFTTLLSSLSVVYADESASLRGQFADAYSRIKKGENINTTRLKNYPLYPYLEYAKIKRRLNAVSNKQLFDFIKKYENTLLADGLWQVWISRLAKAQQWEMLKKNYSPIAANRATRCHYLNAKFHTGEEEAALLHAEKLWMSERTHPKSCAPLFAVLKKHKRIGNKQYWQRIELAINKGKTKLANQLISNLPSRQQNIAQLLIRSHREPENALNSPSINKDPYSRKVIAHAIKRIARKNSIKGSTLWQDYQQQVVFSKEEKADINSYLNVRAALNHNKSALVNFAKIPAKLRTDDANKWMARMALRESKWDHLHSAIDAMSSKLMEKDIWRYWKARASAETGKKAQANEIYRSLAGNATFYGFLSADHLELDYTVFDEQKINWKRCAQQAKKIGALQRALEWFKLGKNNNANQEWYWGLKHLNKQGKLAAASLALEENRTLLAVSTVAKTRDWNQVALRFPMLYQKLIKNISTENNVNPAWVYGIMRRESVFNKEAVSGAKAMGLMQLLPSTARIVAKRLGINGLKKDDLLTPKTNIQLGSAYLGGMLKDFKGSYVKATAGYNAGPGRSVKWTPKDTTLEADQWVESIPFTETRKYVRAVMAYTTIYDHKLNDMQGDKISTRLLPVTAQN